MALPPKKSPKHWIIKAVDRGARRTIAWVTGRRDAATFRRRYDNVKHLKHCRFYTDDWDVFTKVMPKNRHIIGKKVTACIARDNSNTRYHLGRMTRPTKGVSKSEIMVYDSITL